MIDPATHLQELRKWADWGPLVSFSEIYFSESLAIALVWGTVVDRKSRDGKVGGQRDDLGILAGRHNLRLLAID
jgi:hypothetical protein